MNERRDSTASVIYAGPSGQTLYCKPSKEEKKCQKALLISNGKPPAAWMAFSKDTQSLIQDVHPGEVQRLQSRGAYESLIMRTFSMCYNIIWADIPCAVGVGKKWFTYVSRFFFLRFWNWFFNARIDMFASFESMWREKEVTAFIVVVWVTWRHICSVSVKNKTNRSEPRRQS